MTRGDHLLVVTPTFFPDKVGTPHYVADLVRELASGGESVRVVTSMPYYPDFKLLAGYGRARRHDDFEGVPVHRLPTIVPRRGHPLWRAASELNFVLQVVLGVVSGRLRRSSRVLVVTPGVPLAVLAARLLCRRGGRVVVIVHDVAHGLASSSVGEGRLQRLIGSLEASCINRGDAATVLSPKMGEVLQRAGVDIPIEVVGLWPTVEAEGWEAGGGDPMTVLYSGNLGRKQGVGVLLDLAARLAVLCPEARVLVRGQGSEQGALRSEAAELGLVNLEFADLVDESELGEALAAAAVHVVPQLPAGADFALPSKIYNILAVGRPVVATAVAGSPIAELASETGAIICVDPDDPEDFAQQVAELLRDDARRLDLGHDGQTWIAKGHTRLQATERHLDLLQSATSAAAGP